MRVAAGIAVTIMSFGKGWDLVRLWPGVALGLGLWLLFVG